MAAVDEIRRAQASDLVDEEGNAVALDFAPALSPTEIESLQAEIGVALPRELRSVLERTAGIEGAAADIDFTGRDLAFGQDDLLPGGIPIAHDGFGNFWVLDVTPADGDTAPVFFACHDPPVLLYQSPHLEHFLRELFRMFAPPHTSLLDDVHEDRIFDVWGKNPGAIDHATALASGDKDLGAFAAQLDERFLFVDLRAPEIGMGFSWGRYGHRTQFRRYGYERLFAYAPPEKKPGLLGRLFG